MTESLATKGAGEAVILVVGSKVCHHVSLLGEGFATDAAGVRLLLRVNAALVRLEVASLREALGTVAAVVVLLPSVYLHVRIHVALLRETLPTDLPRESARESAHESERERLT